ncbi:MAG: tRNA dihydrouridine synthase DusB [Clostridia bacterium]|nr:tRNA dihydrouridine synthase DusB [Clostridia bacterium]
MEESKRIIPRVMLAPMAGYSDSAMRVICAKYGAEYTVTEMISAKAVTFGDKKTAALAAIRPDEGRVGLQIFGSEPDVMANAAERLSCAVEGDGFVAPAAIDVNMGCPVNKIYGNGEGSALMKSPELIEKITRAVVGATALPVTVKMRIGVDAQHINAVECALAAQEGGATMICVHGRTRVELYSGTVHRDVIRDVNKHLHIPVIANGDIRCAADALSMLSETGAYGVAIGRGAVGNPFIFSEILAALDGGEYVPPTLRERVDTALLQLRLSIEEKGEARAVNEARKQIALYLSGFRGAAKIRGAINTATTYAEVERVFYELLSAGEIS